MMVMVSNNTQAFALADEFGRDLVGQLHGVDGFYSPRELDYALDNGAWPAFKNGLPWDAIKFCKLWDWAATLPRKPRWGVVPDVVTDREATIRQWRDWAPKLRNLYGWPLAFAVQDGMTHQDVPADADVVFVGGSTAWKRRTMADWCARFPRVHIARMNTERWLWQCQALGAESVDGTGWFYDNRRQGQGLRTYLQRMRDGHGPNPRIVTRDLFGGNFYL